MNSSANLEHVRYISENFSYLKGLLMIPSGLVMLVIGLLRWWMVFTDYTYTILFNAPLAIFILVMGSLIYFQFRFTAKVNSHYAHTFGEAKDSEKQKRCQSQLGWILSIPMFCAVILHFVFNIHNIFVAGIFFSIGLQSWFLSGPRLDAKLFGGSFVLSGLVVLFVVHVDMFSYYDLVMGGGLTIQGLMNHFYLRRHLHLGEHHA
jgi:hypothetical protein